MYKQHGRSVSFFFHLGLFSFYCSKYIIILYPLEARSSSAVENMCVTRSSVLCHPLRCYILLCVCVSCLVLLLLFIIIYIVIVNIQCAYCCTTIVRTCSLRIPHTVRRREGDRRLVVVYTAWSHDRVPFPVALCTRICTVYTHAHTLAWLVNRWGSKGANIEYPQLQLSNSLVPCIFLSFYLFMLLISLSLAIRRHIPFDETRSFLLLYSSPPRSWCVSVCPRAPHSTSPRYYTIIWSF